MASRKLGVYWLAEEVEKMLEFLIEEEEGSRVMTSTHLENISIFTRVSEKLEQEGFQRTPEQCRAKYKREKGGFFHRIPPPGKRVLRFELLNRLWEQGGKPHWRKRRPGGKCLTLHSENWGNASRKKQFYYCLRAITTAVQNKLGFLIPCHPVPAHGAEFWNSLWWQQ